MSETKTFAKRVETQEIGGFRYTVIAELLSLGQGAFFSIGCDIHELTGGRWFAWERDGVKKVPKLAKYLKWHGCYWETGTEWYYIANSLYWAGFYQNRSEDKKGEWEKGLAHRDIDYLKNNIVYGAVEGDESVNPDEFQTAEELKEWLIAREPALKKAFRAAMEECFGPLLFEDNPSPYLAERGDRK